MSLIYKTINRKVVEVEDIEEEEVVEEDIEVEVVEAKESAMNFKRVHVLGVKVAVLNMKKVPVVEEVDIIEIMVVVEEGLRHVGLRPRGRGGRGELASIRFTRCHCHYAF